jgi:hypothetical protein
MGAAIRCPVVGDSPRGRKTAEPLISTLEPWSRPIQLDPRECAFLNFILPAGVVEGERIRRVVVLGPAARSGTRLALQDEEHPFCPCCLLTQNLRAYKSITESTHPYGIRFYVMRDKCKRSVSDL